MLAIQPDIRSGDHAEAVEIDHGKLMPRSVIYMMCDANWTRC